MLTVFDFINLLFRDPSALDRPEIRSQFNDSYMLTRRMAIMYPAQANLIQNLSITDPQTVLEMWKDFIASEVARGHIRSGYIPQWVYKKGTTKAKEE